MILGAASSGRTPVSLDPSSDTPGLSNLLYGRFPKFHCVFLGRDPGTLKSDIVSKEHPQSICSDLRLSNLNFED